MKLPATTDSWLARRLLLPGCAGIKVLVEGVMMRRLQTAVETVPDSVPVKDDGALRDVTFTVKREDFNALTAKRFIRPPAQAEPSLAAAWNEALCCEARNSLQVVLSGAEILLEDHLGNLKPAQKGLLVKMMDNAYHLCHLMTTLSGADEFRCQPGVEEERVSLRQAPRK